MLSAVTVEFVTGKLLQRLIRMRIAFAAQYRLYALGHYAPHRIQVIVCGIAVEQETC